MRTTDCGNISGYTATKMYALVQLVDTGEQPEPSNWRKIDITSDIPGHTVGSLINPINLRGTRFIITNNDYEFISFGGNASRYDIEDYLGNFPDNPAADHPIYSGSSYLMTTPQFGDKQPFPGSIKLVRASDLAVMRFLVNLPSGTFESTQNPTYVSGKQKKITEIALLNANKDVIVIGKTPKPINRTGTQVFAVKIDL
jgi:hypothetical protein